MFQYGRAVEEGPKMEWNMAQFSFRFHHEIFEESFPSLITILNDFQSGMSVWFYRVSVEDWLQREQM